MKIMKEHNSELMQPANLQSNLSAKVFKSYSFNVHYHKKLMKKNLIKLIFTSVPHPKKRTLCS